MNLGDEHMTDETRDIYRAKVAERQAAEDALVQQRVEAASDYVGARVEANRCVKRARRDVRCPHAGRHVQGRARDEAARRHDAEEP